MDDTQHDSSLLTFRVGPYRLCVRADDVDSIITMPAIAGLPLASKSIEGIFEYRDRVAVVISLRRKFGLEDPEDPQSGQLIVTYIGETLSAFRVDEVFDIIPAAGLSWNRLPAFSDSNAFDTYFIHEDSIILHTSFALLNDMPDAEQPLVLPGITDQVPATVSEPDIDEAPVGGDDALPENKETGTLAQQPGHGDIAAGEVKAGSAEAGAPAESLVPVVVSSDYDSTPAPYVPQAYAEPHAPREENHEAVRVSSSSRVTKRKGVLLAVAACVAVLIAAGVFFWIPNGGESPVLLPEKSVDIAQLDHERLEQPVPLPTEQGRTAMRAEPPLPETEVPLVTQHTPPESDVVVMVKTDDFVLTVERPQKSRSVPEENTVEQSVRKHVQSSVKGTHTLAPETPAAQEPVTAEQVAVQDPPALQQDLHQEPPVTQPAQTGITKEEIVHIVVKGDTLWDIAETFLGDPFTYPKLAELSRIKDPDLIYPGDIVRIIKKK